MKIRMMAAAALVLAAGCGGQAAPPEDGPAPDARATPLPPGMAVGGGGPNVFVLLGARQQLALTSAQVTALDSIGRRWSVLNDSLQRQVRGGSRERTDIAALRPVLERMAENNDAANRGVETVLTAEQRRIACTLQAAEGGERRRPMVGGRPPGSGRPGGRGGRMRPAGSPGDTVPAMRMRRGWPWCAAPVAADSAG